MANLSNINNKFLVTTGGNVGINTTSPDAKLHIVGSQRIQGDTGSLTFLRTDNITQIGKIYDDSGFTIEGKSNNNLILRTKANTLGEGIKFQDSSSNNLMFIDGTNGNVGIGTNSPAYNLQLASASSTTISVIADAATSASVYFGDSASATQGRISYNNANDSFLFFTNALERMRITSAGNVGIGTASPGAKLHISEDSAAQLYLERTGSITGKYRLGIAGANNRFYISDIAQSADRFVINENGNVGIGTDSPTSPLTIKSNSTSSSSSGLTIQSNGNTNNIFELAEKSTDGARLQMYDAGVAKIALYTDGTDNYINAGKVGVGTTSPAYKLDISGDIRATSEVFWGNNNNSPVGRLYAGAQTGVMLNTENDGAIVLAGGNTTAAGGNIAFFGGTHASQANAVRFRSGSTETMRIDSSGNVGIGTTSPSRKLQVKGTANTAIAITSSTANLAQLALGDTDDDNYAQILLDNSTNKLQIQNGGGGVVSNRGITLDSSENVGIGTDSPSSKLHINTGTVYEVGSLSGSILIEPTGVAYNGYGAGIVLGAGRGGRVSGGAAIASVLDSASDPDRSGLSFFYHNSVFADPRTEGMRLNADGNVGIGTTSPSAKLEVAFDGSHTSGDISYTQANIDVYNPLQANTDEKGSIITFTDNYFDGTNYHKTTRAAIKGGTDTVGNTANGFLAFYTDSGGANSASERMRITSAGNVGIGPSVTSPSHKLEVRDGTISGEIAKFSAIGATVVIESSTAGNAKLFLKPSTTGLKRAEFRVTNANDYGFLWTADTSANGTAYMELEASSTGGGDLTVKGDVIAYGSPSDKKYKENIKPIESALDKAMKLQGVTFDWKDSESILEIKKDIGFIAQDVQEVLPELVRENKKGNLSLRYQGITPILLEAIKELKAEIEELKLNNCNCNK